ncbi:hypothetical protein [Limnohabitans sp.]|uniref:hypothetical protein n=1 Tax=Limnohabitans sp. TaxID=1907725 RepID=UPI0031FCAF9E
MQISLVGPDDLPRTPPSDDHIRFFNYLRQSITYKLAWDFLQHGTKPAKATTPPDFDVVVACAKNFGDVWNTNFFKWWLTNGRVCFGVYEDEPMEPRLLLASAAKFRNLPTALHDATSKLYPNRQTPERANFYVELPQELSRSEAIRFVTKLYDAKRRPDNKKPQGPPPPKYKLLVNKINNSTLDLGPQFLELYKDSQHSIWEIVYRTGVSPTLCKLAKQSIDSGQKVDSHVREKMAITGHRFANNAVLIAENAARGRFPCVDRLPHQPLYRIKKTP